MDEIPASQVWGNDPSSQTVNYKIKPEGNYCPISFLKALCLIHSYVLFYPFPRLLPRVQMLLLAYLIQWRLIVFFLRDLLWYMQWVWAGIVGNQWLAVGLVDIQRGLAGSEAIAFSGLLQKLLTMETFKTEIELLLIYHAVLSSHAAFSIIATR